MQHQVIPTPADHLIIMLEHARADAIEAGLMEVGFIVELAIAATVEAVGGLEAASNRATA